MTSAARAGRRRRLLHDGAAAATTTDTPIDDAGSRARYAPPEGSASFAIAGRLLPTSRVAIALTLVLLPAAAAALAALDRFAPEVATAALIPSTSVATLSMVGPGSIAGWWAAALWLAAAAVAAVVFGLRRSRMDDIRSGYRWWIAGVAACVGLSLNAATGVHTLFAAKLADTAGFSPLAGDALWWLAPGALVLGGLALRLVIDVSDSRAAVFFGAVAMAATAAGWTVDAGLVPPTLMDVIPWTDPRVVGPVAGLLGVSMAILAMLCAARGILREAEGAVVPRAAKSAVAKTEAPSRAKRKPTPTPTPKPAPEAKPAARRAVKLADTPAEPVAASEPSASEPTQWVDGGDDFQEDYDDKPQRRRLSKAERKRLRKQKARRAA